MSKEGVLSGVRVLDFGRFIAGPFCAALLADHGAEVIRVDRIGGSEDRYVLPLAEGVEGPTFMQVNRGKRSLTLAPTLPEGRKIVQKLVARSDIVIANLTASTLTSLGLDYATLSKVNPRIILVATDAFGRIGPNADKVGLDGIAQSLSGTVFLSGDPGAPRRAVGPYVDFGTAVSAAFGAVLALMARTRTNRGQEVTTSLMMTALTVSNAILMEQAVANPNRVPQGNLGFSSAPQDVVQCSDGRWLITQVIGDALWQKFCKMLGADEWLTDPRFDGDTGRSRHGSVVSDRLRAWCAIRTRDDAIKAFEAARIPVGPIYSPQEALEDAHIRGSGILRELAYPGSPLPIPVVDTPVQLSDTPASIRGRAPMTGEHTVAILGELGYSGADIVRLQQAGIV